MDAAGVGAALERFVEQLITKITLDCTANLIETTPVDTGWARANWVPGLGLSNPPRAPQPEGAEANSFGTGSVDAGIAEVVAGYRFPGIVQIANGVPYINRLNDGHSKQAPAGFIQKAINKALTVDIRGIETR